MNSSWEYYWDNAAYCCKVGRTDTLDLVFTRIKKGLYILPKRDIIMPFASDLFHIYNYLSISDRKLLSHQNMINKG